MLKKSFILLSVLLLFFGVLSGCSTDNKEVNNTSATELNEQQNEQSDTLAENVYPLTVKDITDAEITISAEPKRIISLIPSLTETLFALSLDEKVIAVTAYDNYPEGVQEKVEFVFEDALNPNMEQILNLNPDLILIGPVNDELTNNIRNLKIPTVKFDPKNIAQVYETIEKVGLITNANEQAKLLINNLKEKEEFILGKVANIQQEEKVRVWPEISNDLWTSGKGTFIDELINKAGGINIVEEEGWIQYNEEKVIEKNPQVILITYDYIPNAVEEVLKREGWEHVDALTNQRVYDLNSDLVTRPGPRIINGLEEIAKALYPDLFK